MLYEVVSLQTMVQHDYFLLRLFRLHCRLFEHA